MKNKSWIALISSALSLTAIGYGQQTWTGAGDGALWNDVANWSSALPTATTAVTFNNPVFLLTGVIDDQVIASLTFTSALNVQTRITAGQGPDTLQVNGAITNQSSVSHRISAPLIAGASATWAGPLTYNNNVSFGVNQITLSGAHTFTGSNVNFTLTNLTTYGRLLGSFTSSFTGNINITGAYTGTDGESFDFTTGNFNTATLNVAGLPTLSNGLVWNTSSFNSTGVISVSAIPEPSTYTALFGAMALGFCVLRRRRTV